MLKNRRHETFAQLLAQGGQIIDAYVEAGYQHSPAAATRLAQRDDIRERVAEIQAAGAARAEISVERVLRELARIGFSDVRAITTVRGGLRPLNDLGDDEAAAIAAVEVVTRATGEKDEDGNPIVETVHKVKMWDKLGALGKIGQHLRMFVERHELTGADGEPLSFVVKGVRAKGD